MKVTFVTPSEVSSGESITALHMAENIVGGGGDVRFLSSTLTAKFLRKTFPDSVTEFTSDAECNVKIWQSSLKEFGPEAVVFADYPLLFFSNGASPLADKAWVRNLEDIDAALVTLDHLGYAQRPMSISFGPPHLSLHCETLPDLPSRMHVLLPCPMNEPFGAVGRKGTAFRYWDVPPPLSEKQRRSTREDFLLDDRDLLIFHSAPEWAWRFAEHLHLPYYSFLTSILEHYLVGLRRRVTVISVNSGSLLAPSSHPDVRVYNLAAISKDEFERLLHSCDLMITENSVSMSLGKAVCSLRPCAVLRNSHTLLELISKVKEPLRRLILKMEERKLGAIFPFEVFPIWRREDIEQLGLFDQNTIAAGFAQLELFEDEATREHFQRLLLGDKTPRELRAKQEAYLKRLYTLCDANTVLQAVS